MGLPETDSVPVLTKKGPNLAPFFDFQSLAEHGTFVLKRTEHNIVVSDGCRSRSSGRDTHLGPSPYPGDPVDFTDLRHAARAGEASRFLHRQAGRQAPPRDDSRLQVRQKPQSDRRNRPTCIAITDHQLLTSFC
jgi:hypothetical protein